MSELHKDESPQEQADNPSSVDTWKDLSGVISIEKPETGRNSPMKIRPSLPPLSPAKFRVKGLKLLIIDNDPMRVDALAMDLRNLGAQVAVGDFSTNGYTQAAKFLPDAIVSDLVRPGEEGFLFIQSLRRHPLLRWSSVILSRWWQETADGEGEVLIDRVLDRLEDLLAPIRIIEERIAARRPLSDRIEMTGPAALLRVLSGAALSGSLSVNDSWNMFTVDMAAGKILSAYRKGIDGEADEDLDAILQLMLCESGKWTFAEKKQVAGTAAMDAEGALNQINKQLSRLFGRNAKSFEDLEQHIAVRPYFLRTASETVSAAAIEIARDIADGSDLAHFRRFFGKKSDLSEVEQIVHTLFRCGAIRYLETPAKGIRSAKEIAAARSVVHLLKALIDNPFAPSTGKSVAPSTAFPIVEIRGNSPSDRPAKGAYHLQDVAPERVAPAKVRPMKLILEGTPEADSRRSSAPPAVDAPAASSDRPGTTDVVVTDGPIKLSKTKITAPPNDLTDNTDESGSRKFILESQRIAIGDLPPEWKIPLRRDRKHMWAAILLAIVLGGALAAGIAFVAAKGKTPSSQIDNQP